MNTAAEPNTPAVESESNPPATPEERQQVADELLRATVRRIQDMAAEAKQVAS